MEPISIRLSKRKLALGLASSLAFVACGTWMLIYQPTTSNPVFNNRIVLNAVAIAAILFFGRTLLYYIQKLGDKKPGLTINQLGIEDNSSAVPVGFVPWSDVTGFSTVRVSRQTFLIIQVGNPEAYMLRQVSFLQKKGMQYNYKRYGSPLAITANGLDINIVELQSLLERARTEAGIGHLSTSQ